MLFRSRGDSNSATDTYHPKLNDVIGKYSGKKIPGIGIFIMFFQSYAGIVTILSVIYCSLMISHFTRKMDEETENRKTLLLKVFDVSEMHEKDPELMNLSQNNTIFYKGYAYSVSPEGEPSKREMSEEEKGKYGLSEEPVKINKEKENENENININVDEQGE